MNKKSFNDILNEIATMPVLRTSHLYLLSKMTNEDWISFQACWLNMSGERRRQIMRTLVEISETNFEVYFNPIFKLGLNDNDSGVRSAAINGLWEEENPTLIPNFIAMMQTDSDSLVRASAATALGRFIYLCEIEELNTDHASTIKAALLKTIHQANEDIDVRRRAIESIAYCSDEDVPPLIEAAYYDEFEPMQISAVFAMGRNADTRWLPYLMNELDNPNPAIRYEAARSCGELEAKPAVEKLIQLIEDDIDLEVQEVSIWALGNIGGELARKSLERYSEHTVETLAQAAIEALEELNLLGDELNLFDFEDNLELEIDDEWEQIDDRGTDEIIPIASHHKHPKYIH